MTREVRSRYNYLLTSLVIGCIVNDKRGEEVVISTPDSKVKVMVIPTNEELKIAQETLELVR